MPLDILSRQKNTLIKRSIARSFIKSSTKYCPICEKRKNIAKTMRELKEQSHI